MIAPQGSQSTQNVIWVVTRRRAGTAQATPRLLRLVLLLLMLAALLGFGAAREAEAAEQVPFSGTFTTSGMFTLCGPLTVCISVNGSGQATHLGRTTITRSIVSTNTLVPCADVPNGTIRQFTDSLTLTAANGDTITMSGSGTSCTNGIDVVSSGTFTGTGGTGRFSGASGTLILALVRFAPDPETTTLTGTLSSPGSLT